MDDSTTSRLRLSVGANVLLLLLVAALGVEAGVPGDLARLARRATSEPGPDVAYVEQLARWELSKVTSTDVVLFGDSHVAIGDWDELLGRPVADRGIGGDTAVGALARLDGVLALRPSVVVLMVGFNDLAARRGPAAVGSDVAKIAETLRDGGVDLVAVTTPLPAGRSSDLARVNDDIAELRTAVLELDEQPGVDVIDLTAAVAAEGFLDPAMTWDGIHLTARGYDLWRDLILQVLEDDRRPTPAAHRR